MSMKRVSSVKEFAASGLLANPNNDHRIMVFTAGTWGETDKSLFKFVKPE